MSFSDDAHDFYLEKQLKDKGEKSFKEGTQEGFNTGFVVGCIVSFFLWLLLHNGR